MNQRAEMLLASLALALPLLDCQDERPCEGAGYAVEVTVKLPDNVAQPEKLHVYGKFADEPRYREVDLYIDHGFVMVGARSLRFILAFESSGTLRDLEIVAYGDGDKVIGETVFEEIAVNAGCAQREETLGRDSVGDGGLAMGGRRRHPSATPQPSG